MLFYALHNRSLHRYLAILFGAIGVAAVLASAPLWQRPTGIPLAVRDAATPVAAVGWLILVVATIGAVWMRERRVSALILVSTAGLMVALGYAHLSAPDLALTQVTVEIVTTVLLLLAIRLLPRPEQTPSEPARRRLWDAGLALGAGAGAGVLAFLIMTRPREAIVARDVLREATDVSGENLVHLVLVDFRALDTLGEITVLAIAGLGVFALVRGFLDKLGDGLPARRMIRPEKAWEPYPPQLVIIARLLLPLAHLVAVLLFLRGEAHPGGGFVAGLVLAMAVLIQYMAHGVGWTERRIGLPYRVVVAGGLFLALASGCLGMLLGGSFLTHHAFHGDLPLLGGIELSSALLFDFGVFMAVAGATLLAMVNFGRLETSLPEEG
jgi:multicomponent K+:H+ antiporter subunit A